MEDGAQAFAPRPDDRAPRPLHFTNTQKFQELLAVRLAVISRRDDMKTEASRREDGWRAARRCSLTIIKSNFDLISAVGSFLKAQISPKLYFDLNHYKTQLSLFFLGYALFYYCFGELLQRRESLSTELTKSDQPELH